MKGRNHQEAVLLRSLSACASSNTTSAPKQPRFAYNEANNEPVRAALMGTEQVSAVPSASEPTRVSLPSFVTVMVQMPSPSGVNSEFVQPSKSAHVYVAATALVAGVLPSKAARSASMTDIALLPVAVCSSRVPVSLCVPVGLRSTWNVRRSAGLFKRASGITGVTPALSSEPVIGSVSPSILTLPVNALLFARRILRKPLVAWFGATPEPALTRPE